MPIKPSTASPSPRNRFLIGDREEEKPLLQLAKAWSISLKDFASQKVVQATETRFGRGGRRLPNRIRFALPIVRSDGHLQRLPRTRITANGPCSMSCRYRLGKPPSFNPLAFRVFGDVADLPILAIFAGSMG